METETTLAKVIEVADDKVKYDAVCKRLLSEKYILAWIMKNCLEEYRDCDVEEIAEKLVHVVGTVEPEPEIAAKYEARYAQFKEIYPALKPVFEIITQ